MNIKKFAFVLLLITSINIIAQDESTTLTKKKEKYLLEQAETNYEDGNYFDALEQFKQLYEHKPNDLYYKLMMGICYTYNPEEKQKAIEIIEQVKMTNPEHNLVNFYLGKAYAVNYQFDKAVEYFNLFLAGSTEADYEERALAHKMIANCNSAKEILADTIKESKIVNLGYPINTQFSEYVPVISADESVLIYTYRGNLSKGADKVDASNSSVSYNEDVFISYKQSDGSWSEPKSIGDNINSENHDAAIGLSVDGQTLFIYKSDGKNLGDIYVSYLKGSEWTRPEPLKGDINKNDSWEGHATLSPNGKVLYFASDRKGGQGGRDIWKAELQEDGSWGNVQNLGPTINTMYNEDSPFIHPDNKTLYFSSEGHTSIGGYDIFYSKLDEYGMFSEPVNMGYPINTVDDNKYFVLSADGNTGYYSGGGEQSIGEQDIFKIISGKSFEKPVLALIVGKVYCKETPVGATMDVYDAITNELVGSFRANSKSGKYVMALTPGKKYFLEVLADDGRETQDTLNIIELSKYVKVDRDFEFCDSLRVLPNLQSQLASALQKGDISNMFKDNIVKDTVELTGLTKGRVIEIENIYYDFDKWDLRPESKKVLDNLVVILNEHKTIKIELGSHTDSRGSDRYNQLLSQRRAQSVVDYLIAKGIKKERLIAKGYGETKPVVTDEEIAKMATEEEREAAHQKNRRTEFTVLED
ncbi:MAG: OmpA family protein [Vicingaceae bacterium]